MSEEIITRIHPEAVVLGMSPIKIKLPDRTDPDKDIILTAYRTSKWLDQKRFVKDCYVYIDYTALCDFVGQITTVRVILKPKLSESITLDETLAMCEIMIHNENNDILKAYKHVIDNRDMPSIIKGWANETRARLDEES